VVVARHYKLQSICTELLLLAVWRSILLGIYVRFVKPIVFKGDKRSRHEQAEGINLDCKEMKSKQIPLTKRVASKASRMVFSPFKLCL